MPACPQFVYGDIGLLDSQFLYHGSNDLFDECMKRHGQSTYIYMLSRWLQTAGVRIQNSLPLIESHIDRVFGNAFDYPLAILRVPQLHPYMYCIDFHTTL